LTVRRRTLLSMLSVVGISGGVCTLIGGHLLWRRLHQEARNRVRQDLNAAQAFYDHRLEATAGALRYTALGERFSEAVARKELSYLRARLDAVRKSAALDILYVTDAQGQVICRAHSQEVRGDSVAADRLVGSILKGSDVISGTVLVPVEILQKEGPWLAERARLRILPTPKAKPSDSAELDCGMMLSAAAPVRGPGGRLVGVLRAGTVLNQNHDLVDQVQSTVFRGERYAGKPLGTATVFQNDVRISTNVLREDGVRAVGTRVSAEVHQRVLIQEQPWLGRAWVVNDWYVSAYAPIYGMDRKPIGMLYVGVQERKFRDVALRTLATFSLVTLAGLFAAGLLAWKFADGISRPVRTLARASEAIAGGDFSEIAQVKPSADPSANDEISALVRTFNAMAKSLRERDELLKQRTRLQLTRSERLAAVGRLAAGVAHEINNPLTGVLTFSHMMLRNAPPGSQEGQDLQAIIDATTRCREVTRGLLNFSRQNEPQKTLSHLNDVLREALNLTRNQALLHQIVIREEMDQELPPLVMDPNQIQEVAVNVILNAIDAMSEGGTLTVRSRAAEKDGRTAAEFEISDTGTGIAPENVERIFDPFFSTKPPGKGTGLGLAISYGIVTQHGGEIRVSSELNRGSTVTVHLPGVLKEQGDDDQGTDPGGR